MVTDAVVFDVGETLIDETREYGMWADWLGVSLASQDRLRQQADNSIGHLRSIRVFIGRHYGRQSMASSLSLTRMTTRKPGRRLARCGWPATPTLSGEWSALSRTLGVWRSPSMRDSGESRSVRTSGAWAARTESLTSVTGFASAERKRRRQPETTKPPDPRETGPGVLASRDRF